ncbi:zinc ribbon domain-containing protein [Thermogemmatispora sp.]|uniref:zinc ribbon domain-containing protein n=1 Tax=Thermogemmatispora sp. TaxID=1968838 RepID=UPI0035E41814
MGRRNKRSFLQVPHARFVQMLTWKAQLLGIEVIITEETYTSKCSFLDDEPIGRQEAWGGRGIKRDLFRSQFGALIDADVNGSYAIIRKVAPCGVFARG